MSNTEGFTFEARVYPNDTDYLELLVNGNPIGSAVRVEGGYLARWRKKPVKTLKEAAKQCLDSKMNDLMKEHERLRKLLGIVLADK